MRRPVRIITTPPIVVPLTNIGLDPHGVVEMAKWVAANRPECLPDDLAVGLSPAHAQYAMYDNEDIAAALFPHDMADVDPFGEFKHAMTPAEYGGSSRSHDNDTKVRYRELTGAELLPELAGRKCYDSFGLKAGRKTNAEYLHHVILKELEAETTKPEYGGGAAPPTGG